jgi:hypothetical protein
MRPRRHPRFVLALLLLAAGSRADQTDRFDFAGLTEAQVRTVFDALQTAVAADDAKAVSRLVIFPLRVNRPGAKQKRIPDVDAFVAAYPTIFDAKVRRVVREQRFEDLFANWQGVMIGQGVVWISGVCESRHGKCRVGIITINPQAGTPPD